MLDVYSMQSFPVSSCKLGSFKSVGLYYNGGILDGFIRKTIKLEWTDNEISELFMKDNVFLKQVSRYDLRNEKSSQNIPVFDLPPCPRAVRPDSGERRFDPQLQSRYAARCSQSKGRCWSCLHCFRSPSPRTATLKHKKGG